MATEDVLVWRQNRPFTQADLDRIGQTARALPGLSRKALAGTRCAVLPWLAPSGRRRVDACLLLLAELARSRGLALVPIEVRPGRPVTVDLVAPSERPLWNAMMVTLVTHHPLGVRRAFGAHLRHVRPSAP